MPYASKKQRAYLHIHEPKLAAKWDKEYGGKVKKGAKMATAKKTQPKAKATLTKQQQAKAEAYVKKRAAQHAKSVAKHKTVVKRKK